MSKSFGIGYNEILWRRDAFGRDSEGEPLSGKWSGTADIGKV